VTGGGAGENRMSERRRRLLLGLFAGHLILVALGAGSVSLSPLGALGDLLEGYDALSGAGSGYGFFAPGVTGQIVAHFAVLDGEGRPTDVPLATVASHEADLRLGNIVDLFSADDDDDAPSVSRALAASLAGTIFGRHPEARQVVVRLEFLEPASMEESRHGGRARRSPLYEAVFAQHPAGGGAKR
jgi:hypothetical protein